MDMESFLFNFCPSLRCFSQCPEVDTDLGSERVGGKCFVLKSVRHIGIQALPSDMTFLTRILHSLQYYPRYSLTTAFRQQFLSGNTSIVGEINFVRYYSYCRTNIIIRFYAHSGTDIIYLELLVLKET